MIITLLSSLFLSTPAPVVSDPVRAPEASDSGGAGCSDNACPIPDTANTSPVAPLTMSRSKGDDDGCIPLRGRRPQLGSAVAVRGDDDGCTPVPGPDGRDRGEREDSDPLACAARTSGSDKTTGMWVDCDPWVSCDPWDQRRAPDPWSLPGCCHPGPV